MSLEIHFLRAEGCSGVTHSVLPASAGTEQQVWRHKYSLLLAEGGSRAATS
jgi:hypothetical protein